VEWEQQPDGATPLDDDLRDGLKPSWIATMGDLNEAEQDTILVAATAWHAKRRSIEQLLDDKLVRDLHCDMFRDVWVWAGTYRWREMTIGIDPARVSVAVKDLVEDAKYWFGGDDAGVIDQAAATFHHKLVAIHLFPNGNGRHARLLTDLLVVAKGLGEFTWGSRDLGPKSEVRARYLQALRAADAGDYSHLNVFVRT
jgi:Fic-DOC domain mobile mystery protein B